MKNIIVAIDFSKGSFHALDYAISIANEMHSNITLVWVDHETDFPFSKHSAELLNETKNSIEEIVKTYAPKLKNGTLTYKTRVGKVFQELATQAKNTKSDLLVVGTHGITGFEEYWIGSNATRIITHSPCPVISVRGGYEINRKFGKILFPVDHTANTVNKLTYTAELAKELNAEVVVCGINTTGLKSIKRVIERNINAVEKRLSELEIPHISEVLESENITSSLIDYSMMIGADLISITTDDENETSNTILLGKYAQQLVNNSPIPVLSINTQK